LPIARVEELFLKYTVKPTAGYVAKACGVSCHTAMKYIEQGDPARGIMPFKLRIKRVARMQARQTEERVAYSRAVALGAVWDHLERLDDVIDLAIENYQAKLSADAGTPARCKIDLGQLAKAIHASAALKMQYKGYATDAESADYAQKSGGGDPNAPRPIQLGHPLLASIHLDPEAEKALLCARPATTKADAAAFASAVRLTAPPDLDKMGPEKSSDTMAETLAESIANVARQVFAGKVDEITGEPDEDENEYGFPAPSEDEDGE